MFFLKIKGELALAYESYAGGILIVILMKFLMIIVLPCIGWQQRAL